MKLSIQINPLKTISENELRSLPMVVANVARRHGAQKALGVAQGIAGRVRKQRAYVRKILDSQLPRLRKMIDVEHRSGADEGALLEQRRLNFFRVTLIRISAGTLDEGSVASALKAVQDEVAAWLGIDDGPRAPASWRYGQQRGPQKTYAVRIDIEDDDPTPGELRKAVGQPIPRLGPVVGDVQHAPRTLGSGTETPARKSTAPAKVNQDSRRPPPRGNDRQPLDGALDAAVVRAGEAHARDRRDRARGAKQARLVFRRAFAIIPEHQSETSDEWNLSAITPPLDHDGAPPIRINLEGRVYMRRLESSPALGEHWIYEAASSAAPAQESRETR